MARPTQPIAPPEPMIVVDGHSPVIVRSPELVDARGLPYTRRTVTLALVSREDDSLPPIHPTLAATGVDVGGGVYTLALLPRDMWLRLAAHANDRIYLRTTTLDHPAHFQPHRVVWRAATYPTDSSTSP